jgi:hypothetical protein
MSVTGATPTSSVSQTAAAAGTVTGSAQAVVVQVLGSYGGDSVRNGLVQSLQDAAGPGGIVSGTITSVRADGTFTLQTKTGTELLLHHPPELPLTVGSAVALRIVSVAPTPQVAVLTIDGKLVSSQLTRPAGTPQTAPPQGNPAQATAPAQTAPGPALPPATLASTLFAALSFEDEVAIEAALSGDGSLAPIATQAAGEAITADADSVIATLVRPAPARLGSAPITPGTRYLATLSIGGTDSEPATAVARPAGAATPAVPVDPSEDEASAGADDPSSDPAAVDADAAPSEAPAPSPQTAPTSPPAPVPTATPDPRPLDLGNFTALTTTLAGRVLPTSTDSETLVETALGTLSIPVQDAPPPTGAAIQLKITAVAPPLAQEKPATEKPPATEAAPAQPVLQDAARALAIEAPALAQQLQTQLSLPPTDQLAALILSFLGGLRKETTPARWPDAPLRKALVDAGRSDLASRLDTEASPIGKTQPAPPGEWSVTVLPFLGLATTKPMRLYRRTPDEEEREKGGGERFVIELQLVRLGAMQFDGLVRERRFDLVLRSEQALDDGLRAIVEQTFRDSLLISGWSGEISYARTGPVPLIPLQPDGAGIGISI